MEKKKEHSPFPWFWDEAQNQLHRNRESGVREPIAAFFMTDNWKEDADFVFRAVNCHEGLLAALVAVRNDYRAYIMESTRNLDDAYGSRTLAQIDRAIAKAEGRA